MRIFATGARGLIGSRIGEILSKKHDFTPITSDDIDIKDKNSVFSFLKDKEIDYLLHLAAKTDVDGCELEKDLGEGSDAWKINVIGTKNIAEFCSEKKIKLIYISTDFVFSGEKPEGDFYFEEDDPDPINFYAQTKFEGERAVKESGADNLILRIAYPYRKEFESKKDFVRAILHRLKEKQEISAISDHIMCPTFIDDIAMAIDRLIEKEELGVFHVVGSTPISPYDASIMIARKFGIDESLISRTTREEYFKGKAPRPFNLSLKNDKIKNLRVDMKTFEEGLEELKNI